MDTAPQTHASQILTPATVIATTRREFTRHWRLTLAAVALLLVGVFLFISLRPIEVTAAQARVGTAVDSIYASGVVEYVRQADVAPVVSSPIRAVRVSEGQAVKAGQMLAELVDGPQQATALQLAAQAALARDGARRTEKLFASGYASRAARDDARNQAAAAEAAARAAREQLKDYRIVAPFAGRVIRREAEPGDLARPASVLFVIADTSALRVTADVDERDTGRLALGNRALVRSDAFPGQRFEASVREITPQGDSTARVFRARLSLPADTALKPGMTVESNIVTATRDDAILVPADAAQTDTVWVVEDGRAHRRAVTRGALGPDLVEITKGVKAGETVIRAPPDGLRDGARVRAAKAP